MTPTPEEIELARRVADKHAPVGGGHGLAGLCEKACFDAALTAIMEVRKKAADYLRQQHPYAAQAIRNGEHLK